MLIRSLRSVRLKGVTKTTAAMMPSLILWLIAAPLAIFPQASKCCCPTHENCCCKRKARGPGLTGKECTRKCGCSIAAQAPVGGIGQQPREGIEVTYPEGKAAVAPIRSHRTACVESALFERPPPSLV
jgi:hypothetical protein